MKSIFNTIKAISILIVGMVLFFTFCGRNDSKDNGKGKGVGRLIILNQLTRTSTTTSTNPSGTTITIPQGLGQ
jgi:hypothetical protein